MPDVLVMQSKNFEHLRTRWPELASLCGFAEQYAHGDPESAVVAAKASVLDYKLLEELITVPRTSYLARVANPHPDAASASRTVTRASRAGSEGVL